MTRLELKQALMLRRQLKKRGPGRPPKNQNRVDWLKVYEAVEKRVLLRIKMHEQHLSRP